VTSRVVLRLYVDDGTVYSRRAMAELEAVRRAHLAADAEVEVIDIQDDPAVAEREGLLAVPALVRVTPPPARRIIGDLRDRAAVLSLLDLPPASETA
jgi:circadian clock protein KaiB